MVYPTFADVKLRKLPFYEVLATLLKPSSLQPQGQARFQEQTFSFHLTPQQVSAIEQSGYRDTMGRPDYKKQIQVRFSLLETSCEQMDNFPSSICVKVRLTRYFYDKRISYASGEIVKSPGFSFKVLTSMLYFL